MRGYLLRDGNLEKLTKDHTTVAMLVERGQLTEGEAAKHPLRHQVERAVGPFQDHSGDLDSTVV